MENLKPDEQEFYFYCLGIEGGDRQRLRNAAQDWGIGKEKRVERKWWRTARQDFVQWPPRTIGERRVVHVIGGPRRRAEERLPEGSAGERGQVSAVVAWAMTGLAILFAVFGRGVLFEAGAGFLMTLQDMPYVGLAAGVAGAIVIWFWPLAVMSGVAQGLAHRMRR